MGASKAPAPSSLTHEHQGLALPYAPRNEDQCQQETEYYDRDGKMCCRKCPPGQRVIQKCSREANTLCEACNDGTFTKLWNQVQHCLSCNSPCPRGLEEIQKCTKEHNRICACPSGKYCKLKLGETCQLCIPWRKCLKGFGTVKNGSQNSNVECAPCQAGTFSDQESFTEPCKPHRICKSVSIPGTNVSDAVCNDSAPDLDPAPGPVTTKRPALPSHPAPTSFSGVGWIIWTKPAQSTLPPVLEKLTYSPIGVSSESLALPVGLMLGLTVFFLLIIGAGACFAISWRKKKLLPCLMGDAKMPHLPAEKGIGPNLHNAPSHEHEQQHLLPTGSISSSSLNSQAGSMPGSDYSDPKEATKNQQRCPGLEHSKIPEGVNFGSMNSDHPLSGGTHVNVTCIVNVCSSDHSSQCPSQTSADYENPSPGSPSEEENVPFSKEERPWKPKTEPQSSQGVEDLLQDLEEKPLPLGVPDRGMKLS
uniref:TNF receptor superfamily member 1B n=1 Tax=Ornithorhynchus anatinus TaxID=9258 RepID=F6SKE0_ORNAN